MKTTLEIADALLERAKRYARNSGKPLRAVVEEGLRRLLESPPTSTRYDVPDRSVGKRGDPNPLEGLTWQDLRDEIYGGR